MKKSVALILALVMILGALAGCASGDSKDKDKKEDVIKEFAPGEITDDNVYTNDFAEIKFTLPEGWMFATEEDIAKKLGISVDDLFGGDDSIESAVYDMLAFSPTGDNIVVKLKNTASLPDGASMTIEDYIDYLVENLNDFEGIQYSVIDTKDMKVGGQEYTCLSMEMDGFGVYLDHLIRREGKYMVCITVSALTENPVELIGENFS